MDGMLGAVRAGDLGAHRLGVLGAEVEDVADLDAARGDAPLLRQRGEGGLVVLLVGRGVGRGPALDDRRQVGAEVGVLARHRRGRGASRSQKTALSPVSARMMNSWLRSPPIGPESARIGIAFRPSRAKVRR